MNAQLEPAVGLPICPDQEQKPCRNVQIVATPLLKRRWTVAMWLAIAALGIGVVVSRLNWPLPKTHDEFSYLLAADTFCHGRLTNPTHPQWQHFETFHVIQQPTYASKYPPGQGAFLAIGQWLIDRPIAGVWLLSALAAAATYWMLLGWTSPKWAAIGSMLWLLNPGMQLRWGQSYWGGTLAFAAGALVAGAAVRMRARCRVCDAVAMAAGAVLLAFTRPFEGLIFCLLVGVWILWTWISGGYTESQRDSALWRRVSPSLAAITLNDRLLKSILPQLIILAAGAAVLATYNKAVTGDPSKMPYVVHEAQYAECPMFHWQSPKKPEYRHAVLDQFHSGWAMDWYRGQSSLRGFVFTKLSVCWLAAEFFFTPVLAIGLLFARPGRWRRVRPAALIAVASLLASLASVFSFPHYMAPFAPLFFVVAVAGLRRLDWLSRKRLGWRFAAPALVGFQACLFLVAAVNHVTAAPGWSAARATISAQLRDMSGQHLVVVRYGENHNPHHEWVYNHADIDRSTVVWARAMNTSSDEELLRYFNGRQAWLLDPEKQQLQMLAANPAKAAKQIWP
jgi:hypothetical protein